MTKTRTGILFALLAVAALPRAARGCSICRCGDATFNALGTDVYSKGAARVGVQIPAVNNLYGEQTEKAVVSAGLTVLF